MGESACLLRSFSHPSDASSREAKEGDPIRALGESISFGRFMSESLAWEKFSAFSHNRYQEELERFSKPGSVAQKKAYFEAHYKKKAAQKASAQLEEPNTTDAMIRLETDEKTCINSCLDSEPLRPNDQLLLEEANSTDATSRVETDNNTCINSCLDTEPLRPNNQVLLEEANTTDAMSRVQTDNKTCINSCLDSEPLRPNDQLLLEEANTTDATSRVETDNKTCINSCLDLEPLRPNNQLLLEEANTTAAMTQVETEDKSCINSWLDSEPLRPNDQLLPRIVLEEENTTAAMNQIKIEDKSCINSCADWEPLRPNDQVIETREQENFVQNAELVVYPIDDPKNEEIMMETDKVEEEVVEQNLSMETVPNAGDEKTSASPAVEKEATSSGGSLKRLRNYSTKLLTRSWSSKSKSQSSPAIQETNCSQQSMNKGGNGNGNATPKSKKHAGSVVEKLSMKSIHMSMNFSPRLKEIGKTTSPDLPQIGRKRMIHMMSSVAAPNETRTAPHKITNRASVNGFLKQPPLIKLPPLDNKRCLKSSNASGTERKQRPPLICSPFSFRSEERVAKRREFFQKLEEKANSKEMGQKQMQETKKNDITKLRQSRIFEAKGNQDSIQGSKSATEHIKRIPVTRPQSPELGRKSASSSMVRNISSLPPKRPSVNSDDAKSVARKRYGGIAQSVTSLRKKMNGCENLSPNILN